MGVKKLTPAAPAAALSAATRTKGLPTRDNVFSSRAKSSSSFPTSREGTLLGAVLPVWLKVTESEQRLMWLERMVRRGICVREIENYAKSQHAKLRSEELRLKECERKVLSGLMIVKLKDEKRNLVRVMRIREALRSRLKRELGKTKRLETLMKRIRQETRKKRDILKYKYNEKLSYLEAERKKEIDEMRRKEIPEELKEYEITYAFDEERFATLEKQADPDVTIGDVEID